MKKTVLDPLSAAFELTALTLRRADEAFYRKRRSLEDQYGLRHGTIEGV